MEHVSHIHGFKTVLLPLFQGKPVPQKMSVGAGCVLLQTADTAHQHPAVQKPRNLPAQGMFPVTGKGGVHQPFRFLPVFFVLPVCMVNGKKTCLSLLCHITRRIIPQHIRQVIHARTFRLNLSCRIPHLGMLRLQRRKQFPHGIHQIRGTDTFPFIVHLTVRQV